MPNWKGFSSMHSISKKEINSKSFDKVLSYVDTLSKLGKRHYSILEEIYKITGINDVLIELLSLYSFIEGFWYNHNGKSTISKSIEAMLKDYVPNKEEKFIRESAKAKIKSQNELFNESNIDGMRHILAHGMYKYKEDNWSENQWAAIYEQRNLLIELVIDSLINRLKSENQLFS
ncbi:hypothetical protein V9L05_21040 [Bernardetia sp. Wsw4-3y2]|uniref:hypothetical protein n=1 Tax=Bernardetia sp. Wsw4-3y2 TaxID=3127471 RepID=UPI0030CA78FB